VWSLLAALPLVVGCVRAQLVDCGDGTVCPGGTVCDANHQTCVTPDQLAACLGLAEGTPCSYDSNPGTCIGDVCFARDCGDRVIEPGEMCDDGNRVSGDGCTADCRSDETCGNGVQDEVEACDDANLLSADGCDSRCVRESLSWGVISCGLPQYAGAATTVVDPDRGVVVTLQGRLVYEWDGASWRCSPSPHATMSSLVYEARRKVSVAVREVTSTVQELWTWDGTTWTPWLDLPASRIRGLTFRSSTMELVALLDTGVASFDPVSGTWRTDSSITPPTIYHLIYDEANDQLVGQAQNVIWRWSFDTRNWQAGPTIPGTDSPTIMYAADRSRIQAFATNGLWEWTGIAGSWQSVTGSTTAQRSAPAMVRIGSRTLALGGGPLEIVEWDGAAWSVKPVTGALPFIGALAALHPETGELITLGPQATYALRGSFWEPLPATAVLPLANSVVIASDPGQRRLVALLSIGGIVETWTFSSSWQRLAIPALPAFPTSILYDPDRSAVVALGDDAIYALGSSGWTMEVVAPTELAKQNLSGLAHDPSNHCLIAGNAFANYELCSGSSAWTSLIPTVMGTYYSAVEDSNRTSLFLVHPRAAANTWERKGSTWEASPPAPQTLEAFAVLYDADRHLIAFPGRNGLTWTLGYRSATPLETCEPDEDADGDGTSGCDDDDCWWSCTPACPPSASCP
jgi:cysteine-rich repeat protein